MMCSMDSLPDAVRQRLAELPSHITRREVAYVAGVSVEAVRKWIKDPQQSFPKRAGKAGTADTYDSDEVAAWLAPYLRAEGSRGGPRRAETLVGLSLHDRRRLTDKELAELRGVTPEGITSYERRYAESNDPFPGRDSDGRRAVSEVAAWFDRHEVVSHRGPFAGTVQSPKQLAAAFKRLPELCTRRDIREATGADERSVASWAARPDFPAPIRPGAGRAPHEYLTKDIAAWCRAHLFPAQRS
jgi:hypothetical protein